VFGQTFEFLDLLRIAFLALLEILLSADNAIVLGILVRRLLPEQRKKALFIGVISSFFIRGASLFAVALLLRSAWIQLVGGAYLIYLCLSHFWRSQGHRSMHKGVPTAEGFWKTVCLVELYDLAFAIDSIVVAVAFVSTVPVETGAINPKLWIVYVGAFIGLLFIRFAAHWFSSLIGRFPRMEMMAFIMIGWIGLKLSLSALDSYRLLPAAFMGYYEPLFWILLTLLFLFGFTKKVRHV